MSMCSSLFFVQNQRINRCEPARLADQIEQTARSLTRSCPIFAAMTADKTLHMILTFGWGRNVKGVLP